MSNIFKSLISDYNTKTAKHIPNDKSHTLTQTSRITWLGIRTVIKCSCENCIVNKDK